jgi:hypothetical protein
VKEREERGEGAEVVEAELEVPAPQLASTHPAVVSLRLLQDNMRQLKHHEQKLLKKVRSRLLPLVSLELSLTFPSSPPQPGRLPPMEERCGYARGQGDEAVPRSEPVRFPLSLLSPRNVNSPLAYPAPPLVRLALSYRLVVRTTTPITRSVDKSAVSPTSSLAFLPPTLSARNTRTSFSRSSTTWASSIVAPR